jgi:hypothetical protein
VEASGHLHMMIKPIVQSVSVCHRAVVGVSLDCHEWSRLEIRDTSPLHRFPLIMRKGSVAKFVNEDLLE